MEKYPIVALNKLLNIKYNYLTSTMLIYFYQEKTFELSNYIISSQTCLSELSIYPKLRLKRLLLLLSTLHTIVKRPYALIQNM